MFPFKVAVVSMGFCPSLPEIVKLAPPVPELNVNRPVQETTTPTRQLVTLPLASTVKLPVVPSLAATV